LLNEELPHMKAFHALSGSFWLMIIPIFTATPKNTSRLVVN